MSREFRDLEIKLLAGGTRRTLNHTRAAARAFKIEADSGTLGPRALARNVATQQRLKGVNKYLAKRQKRMNTKPKRQRYDPYSGARPKTLADARQWADRHLSNARNHLVSNAISGPGGERWQRRERRAMRLHDAAQSVLQQWERTKRPPKGFRRGR